MTKPTNTAHQPNHSNFFPIFENARGAANLKRCPRLNSIINNGIPAVSMAMRYANKKAPPPLS